MDHTLIILFSSIPTDTPINENFTASNQTLVVFVVFPHRPVSPVAQLLLVHTLYEQELSPCHDRIESACAEEDGPGGSSGSVGAGMCGQQLNNGCFSEWVKEGSSLQ